jgi:hypothetical protein
MKLVHAAGTQDVWEVALPQNLRPFVVVATLLPCKALPAIGSAQVEKGSKRWELVIRVRWPTAQLGQKVSCRCLTQVLAHHVERHLRMVVYLVFIPHSDTTPIPSTCIWWDNTHNGIPNLMHCRVVLIQRHTAPAWMVKAVWCTTHAAVSCTSPKTP